MKIAVFGATGRTGIPLVQQALAQGHQVQALVRTPAKMTVQHPNLQVIQGTVQDAAKVEETIQGVEVVISALGHEGNSPKIQPDMHTIAAQNIVSTMKRLGVKRIITLTGAGVAFEKDEPKLFNHAIKFLLKTLSPAVLKDSEGHINVIRQSGLDWVVVRVPVLNENPPLGKIRVGYVGKGTGAKITRADVATFMLQQVTATTYVHDAPMISN